MNDFIRLTPINNSNLAPLEIPLNATQNLFVDANSFDVVYQDGKYQIELILSSIKQNIKSIEILLNNKQIDLNKKFPNKLIYEPEFIFNLLYGIVDFVIELELADNQYQYLFSNFLTVAVNKKNINDMDAIGDMLDDIYKKEHNLLLSEKKRNTISQVKFLGNLNDKYENEINTLKDIIKTYKDNFPYFMQGAYFKTISDTKIDATEKLKRITSKNIQYITTHPEELRENYQSSSIFINGKPMLPEKTLVYTNKINYDIIENQTILSFLQLLMHHIGARKKSIQIILSDNTKLFNKHKNYVNEKYILSSTIIQQYITLVFKEYLESIDIISRQLMQLYMDYKNVLQCSLTPILKMPQPTPIFLEIYHYRNIFTIMNKWFGISIFDLPQSNLLLHFYSADVIYEYFCLLHLYDAILTLGYEENISHRQNYIYNSYYKLNPAPTNTFHFSKEDKLLTLYYQPVVYSYLSKTRNNISLFRTDKSYYSPDFILKKQHGEHISYAILDAKWRPMNTLKEKVLKETVYKYFYSIKDENTKGSVDFLWLLCGKERGQNTHYYHHQGAISKKMGTSFFGGTGIVELNSKSGDSGLMRVLEVFVN